MANQHWDIQFSGEQRRVNVQVLHRHLDAPVCVAGGRHGARSAAAQVAQVGELVVGNGGQGAADGLSVHGGGRRAGGRSGRRPVPGGEPAAPSAPRQLGSSPERAGRVGPCLLRTLGHEVAHAPRRRCLAPA